MFFTAIGFLVSVVIIYFLVIISVPAGFMVEIVPLWLGFRNELALAIMLLSVARLLLEAISAMAIAVGFVGRQLYINIFYLSNYSIFWTGVVYSRFECISYWAINFRNIDFFVCLSFYF